MLARIISVSQPRLSAIGYGSTQTRPLSIASTLSKNVWKKSNTLYLTYIVAGCVILEGVYGSFIGFMWDSYNSGVRYYWYVR